MRALFGVVSLLVVVAVVGLLAAKQLKTVAPMRSAGASAASGATPLAQSRQLQQQVKDDVARALAQGAASRAEAADR